MSEHINERLIELRDEKLKALKEEAGTNHEILTDKLKDIQIQKAKLQGELTGLAAHERNLNDEILKWLDFIAQIEDVDSQSTTIQEAK